MQHEDMDKLGYAMLTALAILVIALAMVWSLHG